MLPAFARVRGHEMAKAALEMAVWELWARREGVPLWQLLGGRGGEIAAGVSVGLQEDEAALLDKVEAEVAAGYRRVKVKIKPGRDVALVAAIRAPLPARCRSWSTPTARTRSPTPSTSRELDRFSLTMIEQPLGWDDIVDHATLQRRLATPLCLDESIRSRRRRPARARPRAPAASSTSRWAAWAASRARSPSTTSCRARGVPVWCGGMLESGIGRLANVHLQTLPGFTLPGDTSASARYFEEDLVDPPVVVSPAGTIAVPEGPGIGHAILWPRVERATDLRETWRRP